MRGLAFEQAAGEQLPWIVEVLARECERCPATQLLHFASQANDLLERLGIPWRITQTGEPRKVTA